MSIQLTKAGTSDAPVLNAISKLAFDSDVEAGAPSAGGPPGYMSLKYHMKMARSGHLFKLTENGLIIGGAVLFLDGDTLNISRIFVNPDHHRKGYGIRMMREIEALFPDVKTYTLDTPVWNVRTNSFYRKLGYTEEKRNQEFVYYSKQRLAGNIHHLMKDDVVYVQEGNVFHLIGEEISRPDWSKALDEYLTGNQINLTMKRKYSGQKRRMSSNDALRHFIEFVSASDGIKVDLATGPSGYFAPFLDTLKDSDCFIITDACPAVIKAHADACRKPNFYILDVDLDKGLPFKDESVDIFTGNLLNNVENYGGLIREACRCLKPGGKLAVIEMFFDKDSKTQRYLAEQGKIWSSYERFVDFCESVGFTWIGSETVTARKGPISAGDLYPLDKEDCSTDKTVYFEK